ncbi:MAG TPA: hypothetical protein VN248_07450 [Arenimonas sp.]|nr:hypothetical protein [Arenimonas sp.]
METKMETKAVPSKTFDKYLHFFCMIFAATIIVWIGMGIIEGFSFGSNTAHWSSIFGGMLGTALIPLSITGVVLNIYSPKYGMDYIDYSFRLNVIGFK